MTNPGITMKPPAPPRVKDRYLYWGKQPPEVSTRCTWWVERIRGGWKGNRFTGRMGYDTAAEYFGIYIWEYLNVIYPLLP